MKRRRSLHFGSVGFAGLGRAIIKNNIAQTAKHRAKKNSVTATKTKYANSKKPTKEELQSIRRTLRNQQNRYRLYMTLLYTAIFSLLAALYFIVLN